MATAASLLSIPLLASAHTAGCVITATPSTIAAGGNTRLEWSANDPTGQWIGDNQFLANILMPTNGSIDNGVGTVPVQGTRDVRPAQTTTYTLTVQGSFLGIIPGNTITCSTTVTVNAPPSCTPSYSCSSNGILNSCTGEVTQCAGGSTCSNGQCIGGQCIPPPDCRPTYTCNGDNGIRNSCTGVTAICPPNSICEDGQCICPAGQVVVNGRCACPAGQIFQGGLCLAVVSGCGSPRFVCGTGAGTDKVYARTFSNPPQCIPSDQFVTRCEWGCANGACALPPLPELTITASPTLVERGGRSTITWGALNVRLCNVEGSNNDAWPGITGAELSKPITAVTIYTLRCLGLSGEMLAKEAKVNIIPKWKEI